MMSLFDLYRKDPTQQPKGLLGGYSPNPEIIDRATLLPIGQYEDGSMTLAWPGFLKDAWDGGVKSLVGQEGAPLFDDGGQYVSGANFTPADVINFASAGPISGIAGRAAGFADDALRGASGTASQRALPEMQIFPSEAEIAAKSGAWPPGWGEIPKDLSQPGRFDAFRAKVQSLEPGLESLWRKSSDPIKYGVETPFRFDPHSRLVRQPVPYEADIDLRTLRTRQPGVWGHQVKSVAENGVTGDVPKGRHLPWVRQAEDGGYVLVDGNHRMSAEVVKGNDVGRAIVTANDSNASLPALLGAALEQPKGIRAYHGSPHDFDKFDGAMRGTGEGGNTFGVGANLSADENYARMYKDPTNPTNPQGGHMYEVNINADEADLLDWHKPLTEQSDKVKQGLGRLIAGMSDDELATIFNGAENGAEIRGGQFMWGLDRALPGGWVGPKSDFMNMGPNSNVSAKLKEAGIPGMRYVEPNGPQNYTIFDESVLQILRKYGLLGTAGLGASMFGQGEEANATGLLGR